MAKKIKEVEVPKDQKSQNRAVDILEKIQKRQGREALTMLTAEKVVDVQRYSSGVFALDLALGGGYPEGRIMELYGSEGSGKTTTALQGIAATQARGNVAAFIDVEHAIDPSYATRLGVDFDKLLFAQPTSGEEALGIALDIVQEMKKGDMVVIDSVANLVPQAELNGEMEDQQIGLQARLMSKAMRKLTSIVSKNGCFIIFINQIRMKIGVFFGNPETTVGGRALKFYAAQRIEVKNVGSIKNKDDVIGQRVVFNIVKNKVSPPFRKAEVELRFGLGLLRGLDVLHVGSSLNPPIIEKAGGGHYSYKGERLGQGIDNASRALMENLSVLCQIEEDIYGRYGYIKSR